MHLISKDVGKAAKDKAADRAPFGAGFSPEVVQKTEALEVWGSSFEDPGPDFCVFRALGKDGKIIAERRVAGY